MGFFNVKKMKELIDDSRLLISKVESVIHQQRLSLSEIQTGNNTLQEESPTEFETVLNDQDSSKKQVNIYRMEEQKPRLTIFSLMQNRGKRKDIDAINKKNIQYLAPYSRSRSKSPIQKKYDYKDYDNVFDDDIIDFEDFNTFDEEEFLECVQLQSSLLGRSNESLKLLLEYLINIGGDYSLCNNNSIIANTHEAEFKKWCEKVEPDVVFVDTFNSEIESYRIDPKLWRNQNPNNLNPNNHFKRDCEKFDEAKLYSQNQQAINMMSGRHSGGQTGFTSWSDSTKGKNGASKIFGNWINLANSSNFSSVSNQHNIPNLNSNCNSYFTNYHHFHNDKPNTNHTTIGNTSQTPQAYHSMTQSKEKAPRSSKPTNSYQKNIKSVNRNLKDEKRKAVQTRDMSKVKNSSQIGKIGEKDLFLLHMEQTTEKKEKKKKLKTPQLQADDQEKLGQKIFMKKSRYFRELFFNEASNKMKKMKKKDNLVNNISGKPSKLKSEPKQQNIVNKVSSMTNKFKSDNKKVGNEVQPRLDQLFMAGNGPGINYQNNNTAKNAVTQVSDQKIPAFKGVLLNFNEIIMSAFLDGYRQEQSSFKYLLQSETYKKIIENFIEFLPVINKKKHIMDIHANFVWNILEIIWKLVKSKDKITMSDYSVLLESSRNSWRILPVRFISSNKYWARYMQYRDINSKASPHYQLCGSLSSSQAHSRHTDFTTQSDINTKIKNLLVEIANHFKGKLKIANDKILKKRNGLDFGLAAVWPNPGYNTNITATNNGYQGVSFIANNFQSSQNTNTNGLGNFDNTGPFGVGNSNVIENKGQERGYEKDRLGGVGSGVSGTPRHHQDTHNIPATFDLKSGINLIGENLIIRKQSVQIIVACFQIILDTNDLSYSEERFYKKEQENYLSVEYWESYKVIFKDLMAWRSHLDAWL